ncbi:SGNH/GDSL hydrolase family protein [Flavobacterium sp. DG1-102-2]|uniref:GDSL-type esterase/lipase family protein n=1 Tax=Flavobacterium sp. DG1-102-2 TaxID=3081663 RepID=UPI0029491AC9|nr:GDSL-type esterase/lipase family protein [Flavobacterium sp. DG1-102-2]MDV6169900.1 SGNH/GDSL hydrolase family protein [Flavobacterium sp. DG1-102-2]
MHRNKLFTFLCLLLCFAASAQTDSTYIQVDSIFADMVDIDTTEIVGGNNIITNTSAMKVFFQKLYQLEVEKKGRVNIVHIGDSHIQADLMTGFIRKRMQERFGNAGVGFVFPHSLARTNGSYYVRFNSNASWQVRRNIYPVEDDMKVGLSGIALKTRENFAVELNVRDSSYDFNTIKVITPKNVPSIDLATSSKTIVLESKVPKKITHKIKNGEVLGSIANKYDVSIAQLKKINGLKSDNIRAGRTLKIPTGQMQTREVKRSEFIPLDLTADAFSNSYHSDTQLDKIYLLPAKNYKEYTLSGLVLEKDDAGVEYHSIGVNGAKCSDYNKYPLFFDQLPALNPDLVIISLGTNESFDKMGTLAYKDQLNLFITNVRAKNPDAAILVMTPPPSLFRRKYPNTFVADYAKKILIQETEKNYATWDLFSEMGGLFSVNRNASQGLMSGDRVHYSKAGYEKQGAMFCEAFFKVYDNFKSNRD